MDKNRAQRRKYHVIYKTTCLSTGRWYIGMHSTNDLNDGYVGSGQRLSKSIKKYGRDQHICEILEHHPDREALSLREEAILTTELRADSLCMNLRSGGTGNYPGTPTKEETRKKLSEAMKAHHASEAGEATKRRLSEFHTGKKRPPETGAKIAERQRAHYANNVVTRSEESKRMTSQSMVNKPKPAETVDRMKAACTGRRKMVREDGSWFWGRP